MIEENRIIDIISENCNFEEDDIIVQKLGNNFYLVNIFLDDKEIEFRVSKFKGNMRINSITGNMIVEELLDVYNLLERIECELRVWRS